MCGILRTTVKFQGVGGKPAGIERDYETRITTYRMQDDSFNKTPSNYNYIILA